MAIRVRKGRISRPYQVYWNNPITGKRESQCFATELEAREHDSLIKHRIQFDRNSFMPEEPDPSEEANEEPTLEMVYLEYLKAKQFSKKGLLWQKHCTMLALRRLGDKPISKITLAELNALKDELGKSGLKPVTVRKRLSVLRTVVRWGVNNGYTQNMPLFPPMPHGHYKKFIPPTPDELDAIMRVAPSHIARVVVLGSQFGVRVGPCELMQLKWKDVDLSRSLIRVHGAKKNLSAPWREVPIRRSLLPLFARWKAEDAEKGMEYLVHYRGKPIESIKHAWASTLKKAGIDRNIRPYDLRHAFGTEMVAGGVDIGTVANMMGHSTPAMLLNHYQYVMDKQKRAAVEALPEIRYVPTSM